MSKASTTVRPPATWLANGRYEIEERIGLGSRFEVFRARDRQLSRPVAVKRPRELGDRVSAHRLVAAEARWASRVSHPNIVPVFDTGDEDFGPYLVVEYVKGQSLRDTLDAPGPGSGFAVARVVRIGVELADALGALARTGLALPRLHPGRVLLDRDGAVKISSIAPDPGAAPEGSVSRPAEGTSKDGVILVGRLLRPMLDRLAGDSSVEAGALAGLIDRATGVDAAHPYPSVAVLREALSTIALEPGVLPAHAVPHKPATAEAPVAGTDAVSTAGASVLPTGPTPALPRFHRRPTVVVAVVALVSAVVCLALVAAATQAHPPAIRNSPPARPVSRPASSLTALKIVGAGALDPVSDGGNGTEDNAQLGNLYDGNPNTIWHTDTYYPPNARHFGNLKPGVGFYLRLSRVSEIRSLELMTPTPNWVASIFVADSPAPTLAGWGRPVRSDVAINSTQDRVSLGGVRGQYVLVWITELSPSDQVQVAEASLYGG